VFVRCVLTHAESCISEVMNGKRELMASQIQKLAKFFHLSPVAFLEYN
jgi:HTH-type transcriptional regulator / antitoxin HigA